MKKVRIGVLGAYRGGSMIRYCTASKNATVVAICDKEPSFLAQQKEKYPDLPITYYTNFEEFLCHDMDAVVLANYANEHAPFAIACLNAGKHVFSEVLPVQCMKEAVELVEAVERSGKIYAYGENYCYMPAPCEMRKLYRAGKIGELEYAEGEYIHNCEPIWPEITYGDPNHWRNCRMYANFYCTHSIGPLIHISGLRPVSVVGFEGTKNERALRTGRVTGQFGIEMITMENGAILKSIHGDLYKDSIWYSLYGSKGRMESAREDAEQDSIHMLYVNADTYSGEYAERPVEAYKPATMLPEQDKIFGHGGSDFYSMYHFVQKILGDPEADTIDVYEALDMCLPGLFAYRSALAGSVPVEIPDLRNKAVREQYRNDTACVDPKVAKDQLLPPSINGTPEIHESVYETMRQKWADKQAENAKQKETN